MKKSKSLYRTDFRYAFKAMKKLILERKPVFLLTQCSSLIAKVAYTLNKFSNDKYFDHNVETHTFFGNTHLESIACGVKIARHNGKLLQNKTLGHVCIFDPEDEFEPFYNPFNKDAENALAPGLFYFKDIKSLKDRLKNHEVSGVIFRNNSSVDLADLVEIRLLCKEKHIIFVLDEFDIPFDKLTSTDYKKVINPDAILLSENIVQGEVPFGATVMTAETYKPWNSQDNFIVHSNTFGSNRLAMQIFLDIMHGTEWGEKYEKDLTDNFKTIDSSKDKKIEYLLKYYNPFLTRILASLSLDRSVNYAYGSIIQFKDAEKNSDLLDSLSNFGVNLRGYSPVDIIEEVIDAHKENIDYFKKMSDLFRKLTGLPAVFPATSGASAVGLGVRLGLMANPEKPKVIVFKGGYSGKTLVSLIGTVKAIYKTPFTPYYPHVIEIDPFAEAAVEDFKKAIEKKDVGLIWIELIQGEAGIRIFPESLLFAIKESRNDAGYLLAVDEIQSGIFRTGRFLNCEKRDVKPDIVTLAKAMSDMVYPMGAVLATDEVYNHAKQNFPKQVEYCEKIYLNQLGAHIALHGITKAMNSDIPKNAEERGKQLMMGLKEIIKPYDFVKEVRGDGLFIGMEFDPNHIPDEYKHIVASLYAKCSIFDEKPVLVFLATNNSLITRFEPPLVITEDEIDTIIGNAKRSLATMDSIFKKKI